MPASSSLDAKAAPCRRAVRHCASDSGVGMVSQCYARAVVCAAPLTRCAPALPFAQELKLWDGEVTLELGHLGLPAGAHLQCRTVCSLRDLA